MRSQLVTALTTVLASTNQFAVSSELPFDQGGNPLFLKNMKRVYVGPTRKEQSVIIAVLPPAGDVFQDQLICEIYLAVDAKNPPSQLDSAIALILSTKDLTGLVNYGTESDYTVEIQEDVMIYTFEIRLSQAIS